MAKQEAGFTLVEVILVMAVSAALLLVAIAGQARTRNNASYVGAVDKIISSINDARNQAASGVNQVGDGTGFSIGGIAACNSVGTPAYFGGVSWKAAAIVGSESASPAVLRTWATDGLNACVATSSAVSVQLPISVTLSGAGNTTKLSEIAFVRVNGGVRPCFRPDISAGSATSSEFKANRDHCINNTAAPWKLDIREAASYGGLKTTITIDSDTGLAHR